MSARRIHYAIGIGALLICLPLGGLLVLHNTDWNRVRPWLDAKTSAALGRPFHIAGDLTLSWERQSRTPAQHHWSDVLPWPHLVARDVHIGDPVQMRDGPTAPTNEMASVKSMAFSLSLFGLLQHHIVVPELRFDAPAVRLTRRADGSNNWTFLHPEKPSTWQLELERVVFSKGVVTLTDALTRADVVLDVDTVDADPTYGVAWTLKGKFKGDPVSGSGKSGAVLSLQHQDTPFPLTADLHVGHTHINVVGTLTKPTELAALDLRLKVSGNSMAQTYALTGVALPETPAFRTEGHLIGTLGAAGSHWVYERFNGRVGASDIEGTLDYRSRQPRGLLSGKVSSNLLQFADLGALIGADSNASKANRGASTMQPSNKVLPVEQFRTERWTSVDADVSYRAERIVRKAELPISQLRAELHLKDGVLSLTPLAFQAAGGTLSADVKLDGSGQAGKNAIKAELALAARHLKLKQLFPTLQEMKASAGELTGDAKLSASGNSVASLLGAANGELKTEISEGSISKLLLEEMGLNIGNVIIAKLLGDKQIKLNCMVTDFAVHQGVMQTRRFIVDTDDALINVDGTINLTDEQLALTIKPDARGMRVFSLRAPLYVRGPFQHPDVSIDKGVLALRAGGALALATLAAPAALIPLISTGPGKVDNNCVQLLAQSRGKPQAPPPGQSKTR